MPIYEYLCMSCGHIWENLVRLGDPSDFECPHCNTTKIERLPTAPGGYNIKGSNSASTKPKSSGSFKKGQ